MHFHLVNVQIISRQPFDPNNYFSIPSFTGPARPPEPNERGWKETVRMNPDEATTVIARFDLPGTTGVYPTSPGPAATSMSGTATFSSTRSTT